MYATKQARQYKEKHPDADVYIFYMDIRAFGKGYEEFYRNVRGLKTNFFRGRPSEVRNAGDHLTIDIFDTMTSKLFEINTDLVVLVPALVPRADTDEFARILRISQSGDGFFLEAHPKLRPMDTFTGEFLSLVAVKVQRISRIQCQWQVVLQPVRLISYRKKSSNLNHLFLVLTKKYVLAVAFVYPFVHTMQ